MKIDSIILAEDRASDNFYPFSIMHCIWEIRVGAFMLFEKAENYFPDSKISFSGRKEHLDSFKKRYNKWHQSELKGSVLLVRASVIPDINLREVGINCHGELPIKLMLANECVGVICDSSSIEFFENKLFEDYLKDFADSAIYQTEVLLTTLSYLWDTLDIVGNQIELDKAYFPLYRPFIKSHYEGVYGLEKEEIYIGENVKIAPGVVIDATEGAVIISDNVKIMPNSVIIGPCFIGANSVIKIGAKIYENCAIGNNCKIGGELENSIIQSYSNKQHEGFLGHSFIGEWVNLGADTNNSDLKNTYENITVNLNGKTVKTERMFLGLLCGDHTKSGINTMFTTGTIAGVCGILVREWFLPNFIPSFSWGGGQKSPIYHLEKAIKTVNTVMARRGKELLAEEKVLLELEYHRVKEQ
jgi:UDP-N-acetylglucosamine diphosphorylase/glucosamine-1-phosphate N-acetyltransferase